MNPGNLRYVAAAGLALLVTFGLFWTMQALVTVGYELLEGGKPLSVDFVRLKRDTTPEEKKREPPKREKPKQAPPPPQIRSSRSSLDPGEGVGQITAAINPNANVGESLDATGGSDRGVVPMVRPDPEYPPQLEARGITGWVTLEFTVTKIGTVKDPRVVAANPQRVFDRAAVNGVRRWRYNPRIVNGEAVDTPGVQITVEFRP